MRQINRLDARTVKTFLANPTAGKIADGGNAVFVRYRFVDFSIRATWHRARSQIGLGSSNIIDLASARAKARALNEGLWRGEDPKAARVEKRQTESRQMTFGEFVTSSRDALTAARFKNEKTRKEWDSRLARFAKPLFLMLLGDIGSDDVKACLDPIWLDNNNAANMLAHDLTEILKTARA